MTQNKTLTDNEKLEHLEKWLLNNDKTKLNDWRSHMVKEAFIGGFDSAKQETAREIAELKVELEIAQGDNVLHRYRSAQLSQEITRLEESLEKNKAFAESDKAFLDKIIELQSQVTMLREALRGIKSFAIKYSDKNNDIDYLKAFMKVINNSEKALSATAKQSLIEHDNEVLERAAKVANGFHDCDIIADAIRELKEVKL